MPLPTPTTIAAATTMTQGQRPARFQILGAACVGYDFRYSHRFGGSAQDINNTVLSHLRSIEHDQSSQVRCVQSVFGGYAVTFATSSVHRQLFAHIDGTMRIEHFNVT